MSLISMINELREHRDTKKLWNNMTKDQQRTFCSGVTGNEDHKTLYRRLKKMSNKAKHDASEKRRQYMNRRIQEILVARPVDADLADIRTQVSDVLDEPSPLVRSREIRSLIKQYDDRIAAITAANKARRAQTVAA